jgi:uncharacterized lipoprotein YehR (DUF1307 family)
MATLDQLNAALIKADAAGNVEDAKVFASEIRRMRAEPPTIKAPVVNVSVQPDAIPKRSLIQEYGYPILEGGLMAAGGIVGGAPGLVAGPAALATGAAGAGLGYAAAKQIENIIDQQTGRAKPQPLSAKLGEAGLDVLTGIAYDMGGRLIIPPLAKAAGWVWDTATGKLIQVKAGNIIRELAGSELSKVKGALASAPKEMSLGEATANLKTPGLQTLQARMNALDPNATATLNAAKEQSQLNQLQQIAGGSTQTASKIAQTEAKNALNARLIPTLTTELNAANIAGKELPRLQGEADRFAQAAANKVEDVRRFTAAGERAGERAANTTPVLGQPRVPGRYTYMGELEKKAEVEAAKAAEGSLAFGEAALFKQQAVDSLAAYGLKPLKSDAIISKLSTKLKDPSHAGNDLIEGSIKGVMDDVAKWTDNNGVIDAWAAENIRKNSVNATIQRLRPGMDQTAQKNEAAKILSRVKNVFDDAIEEAGGTGYRKYLADYTVGRQAINQTKLGAKALQLYKDSPDKFIALVEGNSPKEVEKVFGPGSYNIAKEMSYQAFLKLKGVSSELSQAKEMAKQAGAGEGGGAELYGKVMNKFRDGYRVPNLLSSKVAVTNEALAALESKIDAKLMDTLREGTKSGRSLLDTINLLPASDRTLVLRALKSRAGTSTISAGVNALRNKSNADMEAETNLQLRNALAQ